MWDVDVLRSEIVRYEMIQTLREMISYRVLDVVSQRRFNIEAVKLTVPVQVHWLERSDLSTVKCQLLSVADSETSDTRKVRILHPAIYSVQCNPNRRDWK